MKPITGCLERPESSQMTRVSSVETSRPAKRGKEMLGPARRSLAGHLVIVAGITAPLLMSAALAGCSAGAAAPADTAEPFGALIAPLAAADDAPFILKRCEAQVGASGPAVVKSCVDRDSAALLALQSYPRTSVERCESLMEHHAWSDVKACADRDIAAAKDLGSYADRPAVARCEREMGRFGALMVKNCVDQGTLKTR